MSYKNDLKKIGVSYMGAVAQSMKMRLSYDNGTMTYCLYLAPANMSGYEVCPNSKYCREFCLNGSGQNKCDEFAHGIEGSRINHSRILKTRLFFEDRQLFMDLVCYEIAKAKEKAERLGMSFSVRLNGTSDIAPTQFIDYRSGKNILEIFPDVVFYDYTKSPSRLAITKVYPNYDLTLSYSGHNWNACKRWLDQGLNVAVVFYDNTRIPKYFNGYPCCDGNKYDMRYLDPKGHVVALHYHKTANDYYMGEDGKRHFQEPNTPFIIMNDDEHVNWWDED